MASEQVNKILEAEKKAAEIEQEARAKADDIMINAQKQAQKDYQELLAESRKKVTALYDKHKADDSKEDTSGLIADDNASRELRMKAEPNREAAIQAAMNVLLGR